LYLSATAFTYSAELAVSSPAEPETTASTLYRAARRKPRTARDNVKAIALVQRSSQRKPVKRPLVGDAGRVPVASRLYIADNALIVLRPDSAPASAAGAAIRILTNGIDRRLRAS